MMVIEEHVPLALHTTFKVGGPARYLAHAATDAELLEAIAFARERALSILVLGGGSNMLVRDNGFPGVVIRMEGKGVTWEDCGEMVRVIADAGVIWDDFVRESTERGLFGLANLSAIPGTVGAAPVQNIGAYGVEVAEMIAFVDVIDRETFTRIRLSREDCAFGYRDSIFKRKEGATFVVVRVAFDLSRNGSANIAYQDLLRYFDGRDHASLGARDIREAVIAIRAKKFPPLATIGTAGSFFKNPIIDARHAADLKTQFPDLPVYPAGEGISKISAAFLIDKVAGFRGARRGAVRSWDAQALVLVNEGGASAQDIAGFAQEIRDRVRELTNVVLDPEVVHIGINE
ncbi:MAG TPA: UDP-N-acetylmuramate dehydrogenase [Candidatus Paceibacterota bacterium]|nr:UDP-N-acetylmuramate dehydrogenase [Candidatus Paceibacterota bacterium]